MSKDGIKVIVFDLGNVLVDFDHLTAAKRIASFCDKSPKEIYDLFFESEATALFEAGRITPDEFFKKVKEMLGLSISYETFESIWNDIFFLNAKNRAVYSLANKLRHNYKVVVLSNINTLHYEHLKKKFPVFNVFHNVFTSFELGTTKPDHAIYKKLLEELKVSAEEAFYTDDRPELVESAKKLGIRGFVFKGVEQLKRDLLKEGVEIN